MAFNISPSHLHHQYTPPRTSPLRQSSIASTNSSSYSSSTNPSVPSRTSTIASSTSSGYRSTPMAHKRGLSEADVTLGDGHRNNVDPTPSGTYKSVRQSLRPLPQPPSDVLPAKQKSSHSPIGKKRVHEVPTYGLDGRLSPTPPPVSIPPQNSYQEASSHARSKSMLSTSTSAPFSHADHFHVGPHASVFSTPDLDELKHSSTSHLRTLSKMSQETSQGNFALQSVGPSVAGLHNRRQLKRGDSVRAAGRGHAAIDNGAGLAWAGRNWMDQQRKFLAAYEYLCHIGEAKEWIEDIIQKPIPAIVQLEEALRDGVTLAEVVQALKPDRNVRIFHHPKLQYRHSDNIAVFFRFLEEVELPDLFHFELIDLYEKKNIPKVIHCIHALSWLLYRNGMVDFRIGNLVGQLQFEHHELEEMQKGLDKSGVSMPSFSGMGASFGAEPEPEPVETEQARIDRELAENEGTISELQSQIRGCLARLRLGQTMQALWSAEDMLVALQSLVRGDWARQVSQYRLSMQRFATNLQSAARGHIVRTQQIRQDANWKSQEQNLIRLQSLVRARKPRNNYELLKTKIRREESGIRSFQSAIRGAFQRKRLDEQHQEARHAQEGVEIFQAAARGMLERKRNHDHVALLRECQDNMALLQASIRGMGSRHVQSQQIMALQANDPLWRALQAVSRGEVVRRRINQVRTDLSTYGLPIINLQGHVRGNRSRRNIYELKGALAGYGSIVTDLQAGIRAVLSRKCFAADIQALHANTTQIVNLQGRARAALCRQKQAHVLQSLYSHRSEIVQLQALARAVILRLEVGSVLAQFDDAEPLIEELQAAVRGMLVRAKFAEKKKFFNQNMEKVIKVQSFMRAKIQGQAYKSLTSGKNPPVGTVKNFVHLLNDSDFDFDEEIECERLRKTVVQQVRQNELADQYITQLDIKIALLVKNKITLDEVVKHQKHFGGSVGNLLTSTEMSSKDPFDLKALNKNSRRKLEQYQEMFFILQTQPQYLGRLFRKIREQATPEKDCERMRHLVMGLFGYAQKRREEYYLLKLITRSIKEEVDNCHSLQEYLRGNFFWAKLFAAYLKSPRDRKYMRDMLGPIIKENVIENTELDLESDPIQIYRKAIENEQLRTGQRSARRLDIPREEAIRDRETKELFIAHLQDLRDISDQIFTAVEESMHKMPYGVRYVAQQMFQCLVSRFPNEDQGHMLQIAGHWFWKGYLQPALADPDKFGAIDRGLSGEQKRNLGEVAKVIGQVSAGRLFGAENIFLQPLNTYISESIERLSELWATLIDVPDAESHFDIDEFNDLYAKTKPTLYIKMADIFSIHNLAAADIAYICPNQDDMLRDVIRELGSVKSNEHELMSVGSSEISLTLNPKLHDVEDPDAEVKALFMETKRCILYVIRVQSGTNLMEVMVKPILHEDEERWNYLVRDELSATSRKRGAYSDANTLIDIASLTYFELKRIALENILRLEELGRLSRHNHYQDILNAIAIDIRTKHRRRVQRNRELDGVKMTLARLNDQAGYLDQQLKTYNDYIEQAMVTLQNKKGKKRFLVPFTKQWDHERELQRTGRIPKFGSFKYSAQELANRGILVAWHGYGERQWNQLDLTISSNEVGIFLIEGSSGSISIPGATAQIPLDDLLQAQYNGTQFLEFFGGEKIKVNVNLFLHLIMRKFYKDRDS